MSTHPFEDLQLTNAQSECFALGLVDLAKSDGIHQSELELIEEFLSSSGGGNLDELMKKGFSVATAAELLSGHATNAFFYSCFFRLTRMGCSARSKWTELRVLHLPLDWMTRS